MLTINDDGGAWVRSITNNNAGACDIFRKEKT